MPPMETYHGHVRTPADAIILFEACRLGQLPRVQRRLSEKERQGIKSGSVFVWDEREAGMRRWTDGKSWSASRVSGSFLTYREMEGKRGGNNYAPPLSSRAGRTPDSTRGSDSDVEMGGDEGPDGYRYKPDGLMKQSFSITTTTGNHLHLISYFSRAHPIDRPLMQPSQDPNLRHIRPAKGMYPESTVHEQQQTIPPVTRSPMAGHVSLAQHQQQAGYSSRQAPPPQHGLAYPQQQYGPGQWQAPPVTSAGAGYQPYAPSGPPHSMWPQHQQPPYPQSMPPISQAAVTSAPAMDRPQGGGHRRTPSGGSYTTQHSPHAGTATLAPPYHPGSRHASATSSPIGTPQLGVSQIDPRLMVQPSPLAHHQSLPPVPVGARSRTSSPGPMNMRDYATPPRELNGSTASTIPSIGALMNGANERIAHEARSRSASRSPGGSKRDGPQDIPHDKLGFREDMRALRVLDRAFKT